MGETLSVCSLQVCSRFLWIFLCSCCSCGSLKWLSAVAVAVGVAGLSSGSSVSHTLPCFLLFAPSFPLSFSVCLFVSPSPSLTRCLSRALFQTRQHTHTHTHTHSRTHTHKHTHTQTHTHTHTGGWAATGQKYVRFISLH